MLLLYMSKPASKRYTIRFSWNRSKC